MGDASENIFDRLKSKKVTSRHRKRWGAAATKMLANAEACSIDDDDVTELTGEVSERGGLAFRLHDDDGVIDGVHILLDGDEEEDIWVGDIQRPWVLPSVRNTLKENSSIPAVVFGKMEDAVRAAFHGLQAIAAAPRQHGVHDAYMMYPGDRQLESAFTNLGLDSRIVLLVAASEKPSAAELEGSAASARVLLNAGANVSHVLGGLQGVEPNEAWLEAALNDDAVLPAEPVVWMAASAEHPRDLLVDPLFSASIKEFGRNAGGARRLDELRDGAKAKDLRFSLFDEMVADLTPEGLHDGISALDRANGPRPVIVPAEQQQRLILNHTGSFYVAEVHNQEDASALRYKGPFVQGQLREAVRDLLKPVQGAGIYDIGERGGIVLKSVDKLKNELGRNVEHVHFWGTDHALGYDAAEDTVNIKVYKANEFTPTYSEICDDFLRAMGGDQYQQLATYLALFPDLDRPLIALGIVGPPDQYKTWFTKRLARHWGNRDKAKPVKATKFFQKFNNQIFQNPVVHHDERPVSSPDRNKPDPTALREAISELDHAVEAKFMTPAILNSALRHLMTANHEDIIHEGVSGGTSDAEAQATADRYMILHVENVFDAWRAKWQGTEEFKQFHDSNLLLDHIALIRQQQLPIIALDEATNGRARFGIRRVASDVAVKRQKYKNERLSNIMLVAVKSTLEKLQVKTVMQHGMEGAVYPTTAPSAFAFDQEGHLEIYGSRITKAWKACADVGDARSVSSSAVGKELKKAGITLPRTNNHGGVPVNVDELRIWFEVVGEDIGLDYLSFRLTLLSQTGYDTGGEPIIDVNERAWLLDCEIKRAANATAPAGSTASWGENSGPILSYAQWRQQREQKKTQPTAH